MYIQQAGAGRALMQASPVNRVFNDKPGGLVVDYLGLADELRKALANYTERGRGRPTIGRLEAVAVMLEITRCVAASSTASTGRNWVSGTSTDRLHLLPAAQKRALAERRSEPLRAGCRELSAAFFAHQCHMPSQSASAMMLVSSKPSSVLIKNIPRRPPFPRRSNMPSGRSSLRQSPRNEVVDIFAAAS